MHAMGGDLECKRSLLHEILDTGSQIGVQIAGCMPSVEFLNVSVVCYMKFWIHVQREGTISGCMRWVDILNVYAVCVK
jgi:hypothetical protein